MACRLASQPASSRLPFAIRLARARQQQQHGPRSRRAKPTLPVCLSVCLAPDGCMSPRPHDMDALLQPVCTYVPTYPVRSACSLLAMPCLYWSHACFMRNASSCDSRRSLARPATSSSSSRLSAS